MNLQEILKDAPDTKEASYVTYIKGLILRYEEPDLLMQCKEILSDDQNNTTARFSAFYCLFSFYRRFEKRQELYELVDTYDGTFSEQQYKYYMEIVLSQYYKFRFLENTNDKDYRKAILHGEEAVKAYSYSSFSLGCYNNYVEIVLEGCKYKALVTDLELKKANQYIDRAISLQEKDMNNPPYSRYYCSKARLLLLEEKYDESKQMIRKAIAYESTEDKDSLLRIAFYHNIELDIITNESLKSVSERVLDAEKKYSVIVQETERQQFRFIEILGFFSAVIALIIGSLTVALNTNAFGAAFGIIISLAGCLTLSFTILKALFAIQIRISPIVFGIVSAIILLVLGYCFGNQIFII